MIENVLAVQFMLKFRENDMCRMSEDNRNRSRQKAVLSVTQSRRYPRNRRAHQDNRLRR
jgi:hypothetical protein